VSGGAAARHGQWTTAPTTLHAPRGPSSVGPRRCRRVPSLVQQPPLSHVVIATGGWTGAMRAGVVVGGGKGAHAAK